MIIKILGTGCPKCKQLEENVKKAVEIAGISCEIQKVTKINEISDYGIMMIPALVIDEEVKIVGKVLSPDDIKKIIMNNN